MFTFYEQGYSNGPNMVGNIIGVQRLILDEYPRAIFTLCLSHSLNLVVKDAAKSSKEVQSSRTAYIYFKFVIFDINRFFLCIS